MCDFLVNKQFNGSYRIYLGVQEDCINVQWKQTDGNENKNTCVAKKTENGCQESGGFSFTRIKPKPQKSLPSKVEEDEEEGGNGILGMAASSCGQFLATLDGDKRLILWNGDDDSVIHSWSLPKRALVVAFTPSADGIIVADKAGDVYKYDIANPSDSGDLLLGHVSMLLDSIVSSDGRYLITCDRDEKIRVSFYPNSYNIQSFCLGHKEFISRLKLLPDHPSLLLSGSGDGTCRIWDYISGKCLSILSCAEDWSENCSEASSADTDATGEPCPAVVEVCCWKSGVTAHIYVAASLSKTCGITLYRVEVNGSTEVSSELIHAMSMKSVPTGMSSTDDGKLWVMFENSLEVYCVQDEKLVPEESAIAKKVTEYIQDLPDARRSQRDVSTLYKHYYDNMAEYLKRKEEWLSSGKRPTGRGPPPRKKRKT